MRVGVSLAAELQLHKLTDYEARGQSIWKTVSVNLLRTRSSARFLGHINLFDEYLLFQFKKNNETFYF